MYDFSNPAADVRQVKSELSQLPAAADMRAVYEHGLAVIVRLASSSEDPGVQLSAAQFLIGEAERLKKLEAGGTPAWREEASRERIIAELRELFARHLPERAPLVEAAPEATAEGQAGKSRVEGLPQIAMVPEEAAEMRQPEESRFHRRCAVPVGENARRFGLGQYRRVRVQEP